MPKQRQHTASPFPDRGPLAEPHPIIADWIARGWDEHPLVERRRLRALNALLNSAQVRGYTIGRPKNENWPLWLVIRGERVDWRFRERCYQRKIPLTKDELRFSSKPWKQILILSGYLVLSIKADYSSEKDIYERPGEQLEDCMEKILDRCEAMAAHAIEQKDYWAAWEERRREKLARRERAQKLADAEEERWSKLRRMAADWREAEYLRAFVDIVERRLSEMQDRPQRADLWLDWAHRRIEALDPLLRDPRAVYEATVQKPRSRILSDYERQFGEPDPDEEDE